MKDDEEEYPESRGMKMLDLEPLELHEHFDRLLVAICSTRNDLPLQQLPLSRFLRHDRGRNQTRAMHHEFVFRSFPVSFFYSYPSPFGCASSPSAPSAPSCARAS